MKTIKLLFFALLVISCTKENTEYLDGNENALKDLPCFEYVGYRYYIHPHLEIQNISEFFYVYEERYKSEVESLDSYGQQKWFIPTIAELEEAAKKDKLPKLENLYILANDHSFIKYDSKDGWTIANYHMLEAKATVYPMIKFRIL